MNSCNTTFSVSVSTYKAIWNSIYTRVNPLPLFPSFTFHRFICFLSIYKLFFSCVFLLTLTRSSYYFPFSHSFSFIIFVFQFFCLPYFSIFFPLLLSTLQRCVTVYLLYYVESLRTKTLNHIGHYS